MKPTPKLLADWCTLLMNGYQSTATDYRRDPSALNQQCLNAAVICLHRVAKAVPVLLPEVWPNLRLVAPKALWHADPQFNWDEAEKELRIIQAAAMCLHPDAQPQRVERGDIFGDTPKTGTKGNRRTEKSESKDVVILAALCKHHGYDGTSLATNDPIGGNKLAELANVSKATVSRWFKTQFKGGSGGYDVACKNGTLLLNLQLLSGDMTPKRLQELDEARPRQREEE